MAVISIRLNKEEEKIVKYLSEYYGQDKSSLIKHSLQDKYEDLCDREIIEEFEKREQKLGKTKFVKSADLLKSIKSKT
ncbi:MAG: DUF6290 family protein [Candidatus Aminicenantes bacterium]|nr:DUF6290 family protein [Candidatus Aminicenantes bacterium]